MDAERRRNRVCLCAKGGYHFNVNEDEGVTEAAAVSRSLVQMASALIGRGYHVEMVHVGITTCLMLHEAVQSQLHEWGHAEASPNYDLVARGKKNRYSLL